MSFYIKAQGVTINKSYQTMEDAFKSGRALNVSFDVFSEDSGLSEGSAVMTYRLPPNDTISESVFLTE